jgi:hypothetical protein
MIELPQMSGARLALWHRGRKLVMRYKGFSRVLFLSLIDMSQLLARRNAISFRPRKPELAIRSWLFEKTPISLRNSRQRRYGDGEYHS